MATEAREDDSSRSCSLVGKRGVAGRPRVGVSVALTTRRVPGRLMGVGNDAVEFELGFRLLAAALFAMCSWGVKSFMCLGMGLPTGGFMCMGMGLPTGGFLAYGLTRALPKPAVRLLGVCPKPEDVDLEVRLWRGVEVL